MLPPLRARSYPSPRPSDRRSHQLSVQSERLQSQPQLIFCKSDQIGSAFRHESFPIKGIQFSTPGTWSQLIFWGSDYRSTIRHESFPNKGFQFPKYSYNAVEARHLRVKVRPNRRELRRGTTKFSVPSSFHRPRRIMLRDRAAVEEINDTPGDPAGGYHARSENPGCL